MKWLTKWFLYNPVAANLLMLLIIAGGVLSIGTIRVEGFPQTAPSSLSVQVTYPGGTSQQVDAGITQRIEESISSVPGIKRITSASYPGYSEVNVQKTPSADLDKLTTRIRNQVQSISTLPEGAEKPSVSQTTFTNLALFVAIYGETNEHDLQQVAAHLQRKLLGHPAISKITNLGKKAQELQIFPDPQKLERYNLDLPSLAEQIRAHSLEYRSGHIQTTRGKLLIRADGYADTLAELRQLPVVETQNGSVTLGDIATIQRDFKETRDRVEFQQSPAILLMVSTSQTDNLLHISKAVEQILSTTKSTLPDNIQLDVFADISPYTKAQLTILSTNAWQGLVIILVILGIFLNLRLAFWVALGIPISLLGTLMIMELSLINYSINDITLFGLILVLGILVDDAVVVGESIHEQQHKHHDRFHAAWIGVERVTTATVFGVLTTIAAFSPILWIENELAKVLAGFSGVVIIALGFSLVESKFILPAHLAHHAQKKPSNHPISRLWQRIQHRADSGLTAVNNRFYQPLLRGALWHRHSTLFLFITIVVIGYGFVAKGTIRTAFFPDIPGRYLTAKIEMQLDAPYALTLQHSEAVDRAATAVNDYYVENTSLTSPPLARIINSIESGKIEVTAELSREAIKQLKPQTLLNRWRQEVGELEATYSMRFSASESIGGGSSIAISAEDFETAKRVSQALTQALTPLPGVNDVGDDSQIGQNQVRLTLNSYGRQLGVTQRQLAMVIGGEYGAHEVHRLLYKKDEVKVLLRRPLAERNNITQLLATPIRVGDNHYVPLADITTLDHQQVPSVLNRRDRMPLIQVFWNQDRAIAAPEAVLAQLEKEILPSLRQQYPGTTIRPIGEFEEISDVRSGFKKALVLTLILIYALLAIPLQSYWQPLIIMSVIPFGFCGAILGHGLMDLPVSILSLFGMLAMTGVVINDSLVLITRYNQLAEKLPRNRALIEAGRSRMKAIFLTTVTTVCGLLPLLSETSETAQYLKPAAVSLVFGELFATPITLILIPVLLKLGKRRGRRPAMTSESSS